MKTKLRLNFVRCALATALTALVCVPLQADAGNATSAVQLSAPDKPATLRINLPWADLHIVGGDGDTVTVDSRLEQKNGQQAQPGGLRRLDEESDIVLAEHDNVVSLTLAGGNPGAGGSNIDYRISVPRAIALDVRTDFGGDLEVRDVTGEIEINSANGEVRLDGVAGSAIVNSVNGAVLVSYAQSPMSIVSLTSRNGEIELRLPAATKANVQLRSLNGSILTDFDGAALKTKKKNRSNSDDVAPDRTAGAGLIITIHANGEYTLGSRAGAVSLEEITAASAAAFGKNAQTAAIIVKDKQADTKHVAAVWDAFRKGGLSRISYDPNGFAAAADGVLTPLPPPAGGKLVSGTLNGGGADVRISTLNGKITLRQTNKATTDLSDAKTKHNVTVAFQDSDHFTDAGDTNSSLTNADTLEDLREYVQATAAPVLPAGSKLSVTFTDIDLAGQIRPDRENIRFMTGATFPRAQLKFQLLGTDGAVVKEGERKLIDLDYLQTAGFIGRNDPLYYDKQLLKDWIAKEFRK